MEKEPVVGVFDSGVGGITTLHACVRALPRARFLYLGDNGNAPYGSRSKEEIALLVQKALTVLQGEGVSAAVLACNTATAACVEEMRRRFPFPIIGTEPAVKLAARECKNVLVLCTPCTASSERLQSLLSRFPETRFTVRALPSLAAAIEANFTEGTLLKLSEHLPAERGYDGVVLGCTHYVFWKKEIAMFYGCRAFDGNEGIARRLFEVLLKRGEERKNNVVICNNMLSKIGKNPKKIGIDFHHEILIKTNTCSENEGEGTIDNRVDFLGKWADLNKSVYIRTYVSKN